MKTKQSSNRDGVLAWAVILSFALFLSAAWVVIDELFSPLERGGETVTLPDYTGEMCDGIQAPPWIDVKVKYQYDASTPQGVVLSQSPAGGSRRKLTGDAPTCKLTLTVSLGAEEVLLPNVVSHDVRMAEATLRSAGFVVESEFFTGAHPEGEVFEMNPRGGVKLPRGSRVRLSVSAGTPAVTVTVPNLCGMQRGEALTALWLAQLSLDRIVEVDADEASGTVVRQNYQPGTVVMAGSKLTLYVSRQNE
jgi:serine/threonine-protein kinase